MKHSNIILQNKIITWCSQRTWFANHKLFETALVIFGALLIAISAQIEIPLYPVPVTFQDVTILFLAMSLGWQRSVAMVASYLAMGLAGLPVFAGFMNGWQLFFTPVAGYLIGFLPMAYIAGKLVAQGWGRHVWSSMAAGLISLAVLFLCGLTYLALVSSWQQAVIVGLVPFVGLSLIKVAVVSLFTPVFWTKK